MYVTRRPIAYSERLLLGAGGAYLTTLFVAGFLTNFLPIGSVNTGTILLYSLAALLSVAGLLQLANPLQKKKAFLIVLVLVLSLLSVVKAALDVNPPSDRIKELAIFFSGAWPFFFFVQIDDPEVHRQLNRILVLGLWGLSVFAIFQSVFGNSLPLSLFVLRGDDTFGLHGVDTLRPTGLTGNPIIFSVIMVFACGYFTALWLETRRTKFFLALLCSLLANYLTYTRTSFVLVIPVIFFAWLLHNRLHIRHKIAFCTGVVLAMGAAQLLLVKGADLMMIQRLQNSNPEAVVSTLGHIQMLQNAWDAILFHPWLGTGMGSNSDFAAPGDAIITDGAWWSLFLEFGGPLSILIVASLCIVLILLVNQVLRLESKDRALAIATLSFHAYLIPGNLVDSGIFGHISFGLYWAAMGLSLADTGGGIWMSPRQNQDDCPAANAAN